MGFRWEKQSEGSFWAYRGKYVVGMVTQRRDGPWLWRIDAVAFSRWQPATNGECASARQAKRSLRRAWLIWLSERGLVEAG